MREPTIATDSQAEFDQLQKKLVPLWKSIERFSQDPQTIVVVPSMSIDAINSGRSEEHTSELQSLRHLVCRLLLEKKKKQKKMKHNKTKIQTITNNKRRKHI